jgi:hypothetical protein
MNGAKMKKHPGWEKVCVCVHEKTKKKKLIFFDVMKIKKFFFRSFSLSDKVFGWENLICKLSEGMHTNYMYAKNIEKVCPKRYRNLLRQNRPKQLKKSR